MSSEIAAAVNELKTITNEIRLRSIDLSKLRKRKDELEEKVAKFLDEKDQPGIKYKGMAIIAEDKTRRLHKKKTEKKEDVMNVLRHYNIGNVEKIYNEIVESMRGDEVPKKIIKIKDVKK